MKPEKTAAEIHFLPEISDKDWTLFQTFWESTPSWQNAIGSVTNVPELFACAAATIKGKIIGYGIVEKKSGDVPQLAVAENYRNQGIETQLLAALSEKTESTALSIVNVDSELKEFRSLLEEIGFALTTSQYEMVLKLS